MILLTNSNMPMGLEFLPETMLPYYLGKKKTWSHPKDIKEWLVYHFLVYPGNCLIALADRKLVLLSRLNLSNINSQLLGPVTLWPAKLESIPVSDLFIFFLCIGKFPWELRNISLNLIG